MSVFFKKMTIALISILSATSLLAHELPLNTLHPNKTFASAISYSLTGEQIAEEYMTNSQYFDFSSWIADKTDASNDVKGDESNVCTEISQAKTCGQVDHFYQAAMVALSTCNAYASLHKSTYSDGLVPKFTAPASFVTGLEASDGHHTNYDISEGISFDCVYPIIKTDIKASK